MYVCYVVPFFGRFLGCTVMYWKQLNNITYIHVCMLCCAIFTNKAVYMLYVCVSSDMFVFVYDVYNIYKHRGIFFSPILVNVCLSGLVYLYYVFLVL